MIGQLTHAWPSTANTDRPAELNQFLSAKQTIRRKCFTWHMTWWRGVMSQSNRIKGRTTDEAFKEHYFLWERGASVGVDLDHFNFHDLLHAQEAI